MNAKFTSKDSKERVAWKKERLSSIFKYMLEIACNKTAVVLLLQCWSEQLNLRNRIVFHLALTPNQETTSLEGFCCINDQKRKGCQNKKV